MVHYHRNGPHPLIFLDIVLVTEGDHRVAACDLWSWVRVRIQARTFRTLCNFLWSNTIT